MAKRRIIKSFDLFRFVPSLQIKNSKSFRTFLGSVVSILVVLTILYATWHFGREIFYKQKPTLIVTNYNDANPKSLYLTPESFEIAQSLQNPDYSSYFNESIYTIDATQITILRKGDGSIDFITNKIDLIRCSEKNITLLADYFNLADLKNLYCIKRMNYTLEGEFGQEKWSYINMAFKRCQNGTGTVCKSNEEISRRLDGGYLGMFLTDTTIEPTSLNNPINIYGKNLFTTFSIRAYRDLWLYLKTIQIN